MIFRIIRQLIVAISLAAGWVGVAGAADTTTIGTVAFLVGDSRLEREGKITTLVKDQALQIGDRVITGPDGHVHARMIDNAFISVRPSSRLHIQSYVYAPESPQANRVGLTLESGTARTISGKAGEANREHYRFNTPLAAIGLRGTDYVVQVLPDATRVSVLKGAVVLSAYGSGCLATTLSPCHGPLARELTAGSPQAYLEVRQPGGLPKLVLPEANTDTSPQKSNPPRPEEPKAEAAKPGVNTSATPNLISTEAQVLQAQTLQAQARLDKQAQAQAQAQILVERLSLRPEVLWGRWSNIALPGTPALVNLLAEDREVTVSNALFGLLRPAGASQFPAAGTIAMNYLQGEAYLKDTAAGAKQALTPVTLSQGVLQLDFNNKQFTTSLKATTTAQTIALQAQGEINFRGILYSDKALSNMELSGALSNHANEAGYVFDARLSPNQNLLGAARWSR